MLLCSFLVVARIATWHDDADSNTAIDPNQTLVWFLAAYICSSAVRIHVESRASAAAPEEVGDFEEAAGDLEETVTLCHACAHDMLLHV